MKTLMRALVLVLVIAAAAQGQETPADSLLDEVRTETVRQRGFNRAAETQGTKIVDLLDSLRALLADMSVAPDTLPPVQDTLPPVQLPPVQDTLPPYQDTTFVEVCPEDWTCTPPDTSTVPDPPADSTPAPPATGVSLMGYAAPDMTHPREHGLYVEWDTNQVVDYWEVYGGSDDEPEPWGPIEVDAPPYRRALPDDAPEARHWTCIVGRIVGRPASGQQCDDFDWAPIMRGSLALDMRIGSLPLTPGEDVNLEVLRVDGGWTRSASSRPDSVVFEVHGSRGVQTSWPYRFPEDEETFPAPDADSLIVDWTVFQGAGSMGGSVAYPIAGVP